MDEQPPLADTDDAENLVRTSFPQLDPFERKERGKGRRHLFWGLISVFRTSSFQNKKCRHSLILYPWIGKEYIAIIPVLVLAVVGEIASPVGINKILRILESNDEEGDVKVWVWIVWLLFAPIVNSVSIQWYRYLAVCFQLASLSSPVPDCFFFAIY